MERLPAKSFKDLLVWQKAHQFVLDSYKYSEGFPKSEMFGLTSQFRRASVSIAANIAEGFKKTGFKDKTRLMNIAQGSLEECHYYLVLANDLGYGKTVSLVEQLDEVGKMLNSYIKAINSKILSSNHISSPNSYILTPYAVR
jgi:four helix bundle protein